MVVLTSFIPPTDGIRLQQPNTMAFMNATSLGKGTLFIAESRLSWVGSSGSGFTLEYPHISLHAVSRDCNAHQHECLFLMVDANLDTEQSEPPEEEEDDSAAATEFRFVPEDKGTLDAMFHAMSACQALHPDPDDSFSDDDFNGDIEEEVPVQDADSQMANLHISQNGSSSSNGHGNGNQDADMDPGCFEDADDADDAPDN